MTSDELWENFRRVWGDCDGCCMPAQMPFRMDDVEAVLAFTESPEIGAGPDSSSASVLKLKNGLFGVFTESEDYTGHGCQCGCDASVHTGLLAALYTMSDDERGPLREQLVAAGVWP